MYYFLFIFAIAALLAYILTPVAEWLSLKIKAVDLPNSRKIHTRAIPLLGGLGIYGSFMVAVLAQSLWQRWGGAKALIEWDTNLVVILVGATFILLVGVFDDIFDLPVGVKFGGQLIAAILVLPWVRIDFIGNPFGGIISLGLIWSVPLTLFWVVGLTNTVNFIDGLDGLAAGVCSIVALTLAYVSYQTGELAMVVINLALAGSMLGFLKHNFNPAHIFMGDSGSMFLGFLLGVITVQGAMKSVAAIALLVPIIIMGVPILDAAFAIFRRARSRKPVTQADKDHIHHRLLYKGFSPRQTVVIIYLWSLLLSISALSLKFGPGTSLQRWLILCPLAILSFFLAEYTGVFEWLRQRRR